MTQFRELDAVEFAAIRKSLIQKKGSDRQRGFLEAARSNHSFENWFSDNVPYNHEKSKELPHYPERLTEDEFKDTPRDVEKLAFDTWRELTPRQACRSSFWGAVTINHLKNGIIKASNLAASNATSQSGMSRIDQVLKDNDDKLIDDVVRTILRRLSGLPEARGGLRSIQVNCSFGRAQWREKIIRETIELTGGDEDRIARTLRKSQEYWEKLVNILSNSNSVFGDEKIRTGFIWALSDHVDNPGHGILFKSKGPIDTCMKMLGVYSACQEFGVFEPQELKAFIQTEVIETVLAS